MHLQRARGITCCMWDNSNAEGDNEAYRFLDRTNKKFIYDSIAEAAEKYGAPRKKFLRQRCRGCCK